MTFDQNLTEQRMKLTCHVSRHLSMMGYEGKKRSKPIGVTRAKFTENKNHM